jgi:hypothetical protein
MRERGEQSHRIRATKPGARPLRFALGHALIWVGHRLQGALEPSRVTTDADGAVPSRRISAHGTARG